MLLTGNKFEGKLSAVGELKLKRAVKEGMVYIGYVLSLCWCPSSEQTLLIDSTHVHNARLHSRKEYLTDALNYPRPP